MYELIQAGDSSYYIDSPTKTGVYLSGGSEVWLIDGGGDKDAGRRIYKAVSQAGWKIAGIIATHSNADHVGGCSFIQERTGCAVYSSGIEAAITNYPALEPALLYGGYAPEPLRGKFLMVRRPCKCGDISGAAIPEGLRIIPLPGHFHGMIGVLTPDGVFFCADSVFSEATLEKYHIGFLYDVALAIETLRALPEIGAKLYIPSHAEPIKDIASLARLNIEKILEIKSVIFKICGGGACFEDVLKGVFDHYGLEMDFSQYALSGSTLRSYLGCLLDAGELEAEISNNKLLWKTAKSVV